MNEPRSHSTFSTKGWDMNPLLRLVRVSSLLGVALLMLSTTAALADSIDVMTYNINFTQPFTTDVLSGSFTYDADTATFSNFTVNVNGSTFDFTASANNPVLVPFPPCL